MTKSLVIVESPAKARTIAGFLGDGYVVESSIGHIRDLPKNADEVPLALKKVPWAKLGVDVDNDFKPLYVIDSDKKAHIQRLKTLVKDADQVFLATDEDREGESIAWHLHEVLQPKVPVRRMVFHEITRKAIQAALASPREIDGRLVQAQEARRVLDRLFGYEVSPVLWKKILPKLSAGRVQSVATRVLVERERERMAFVAARYWDLNGQLAKIDGGADAALTANLVSVDGKRLATGKDFGEDGKLTKADVLVLDETGARSLAKGLEGQPFKVRSIDRKPYKRSPMAPFMTSTLQQEAGRKLRFSASRTMKAAQRLYENGFITYMRTDSTTLSESALQMARRVIEDMYGRDYLPAAPRTYVNKVKNAQEAHEAIRPAGDAWKTPDDVAREVGPDEAKVYELVWKRTVASQMQDVRGESVAVKIVGRSTDGREAELSVAGNTIEFAGFYRAYVEGSDDPEAELESREKHLPVLHEGEALSGKEFVANGHETQPPARFTEASLVRKLEELGVGRPSTYASTLSTIQDRGYVIKKGTALVPSWTAFAVVTLLERHFPELVDYAFTARMEDDLDEIANGEQDMVPWLKRFYFGGPANGSPGGAASAPGVGLKKMVNENLGDIDARSVNSIMIGKDPAGVDIVARVGRYGPYVQRGEDTISIPEDLAPDELTVEKALALLSAPSGDRELGKDPATGLAVLARAGRFGSYVQLGVPPPPPPKGTKAAKGAPKAGSTKDAGKPKTASLFKTMTIETLTLEEALRLLTLPRTIGVDPADDVAITAQNGRYGPYIQKGTESRSLESEDQIFTVAVEQALALLAQPKDRRRRAAAAGPLRELGEDPVSKKPIVLREGRFGPYVSDGDTVASLRKGDTIEGITPERAQELIAERRERGPSTKSRRGRGGARGKAPSAAKAAAPKAAKAAAAEGDEKPAKAKGAAKKGAAKKTAKKATAKKAADGKAAGATAATAAATPASDGDAKAARRRSDVIDAAES